MISLHAFNFMLGKTQKSMRNNFCDAFVNISGKYKNNLTHIDTPANVQNNYIKLSDFVWLSDFNTKKVKRKITCQ